MKSILAALLLTTATPAICQATPETEPDFVATTEATKANAAVDEMMAVFSKMFDTSKLPPPEPARLKLAEMTASNLLPDGTYEKIINDMLSNIMMPMFDAMPGVSDTQIAMRTGVSSEVIAALSAENKEAIALIIDPQFKQRGDNLMAVMKPLIGDVMAELEPAMRTGLSRAYARKFSAVELNTINGFFATETGSSFARQSFALQADPEVLKATFEAIPAIIAKFMADEGNLKAKFASLPKERTLSDLSDAEMQKLAQLFGVTVQSLSDYRSAAMTEASDMPKCAQEGDDVECTDADWAAFVAAEEATAATAAAAEEAIAMEAQKKLRSAWSEADLKAVEQAEAAQAALSSRHAEIDQEVADADLQVQSAIDAAKRNAGQPVEELHDHEDADGSAMPTTIAEAMRAEDIPANAIRPPVLSK